ncbi:MAG TPA: SLC13 family permease [Thermoanaerobaculia bacterium]
MATPLEPAVQPATFELRPPRSLVIWGRVLCIVVPIVFWFLPLNLAPPAQHAMAISLAMIIAWITQAHDHAIVGLIGCFLCWALKVTKFEVAFDGFSNSTTWFLFGAMLFGMMATKSGLARRLAYLVMRRMGHTYAQLLLGLIISDFLLTFLVPSGIARVVLMAAVALGLIEAFGVGPGSNIGRGMFIILTYTATIFDKMIIAGAASITARGLIEKIGQVEVLWSRWLLAYLPCDLITIFVAWRLVLWLYPPEQPSLPGGPKYLDEEVRKMGPWSTLEKKSAALMSIAIILWMTDFIHGISPAMIGLGIGLAATLPRIGVLTVPDVRRLNYLPIFFVAAALSMSDVLRETKALDVLSNAMIVSIEPYLSNIYSSTLVISGTAFAYHIFLGDEVAMISTSLPVLLQYARTHGLDPLTIGMMWTFAVGAKIFVFQSAVLVVGFSFGYFDSRDMFRVGIALSIVQTLILLLLVPLYWPLIGLR